MLPEGREKVHEDRSSSAHITCDVGMSKVIRVEKRLWHSAQIVRLSMILMDLARFEVLAVAYEKISQ